MQTIREEYLARLKRKSKGKASVAKKMYDIFKTYVLNPALYGGQRAARLGTGTHDVDDDTCARSSYRLHLIFIDTNGLKKVSSRLPEAWFRS
jgi:hypothetical protein